MDFKRKLGMLRPMDAGRAPPATIPASAEGRACEDTEAVVPRSAARASCSAGEPHDERIARLRALMGEATARHGRRAARRPPAPGPAPLPVGTPEDTPLGPVHVVARTLPPDARHGRQPVVDALAACPQLVAKLALDPSLAQLDLSRMLVLDTETTGLAGGTGTVAFLVGLSFFDGGQLRVEQLLLPNLGQEGPLLHRLGQRIAAASCVVSYNGKSFDWPLLRSRFILNRVPAPTLPPHLDLLHCARRIFKGRMASVRLIEMERELLGFAREGDIDGAAIPDLYMGYLRGGDPRVLLPILEHNDMDVVALPALLAALCGHFEAARAEADPRDQLAYARVAARAADPERACAFAEAAVLGATEAGSPVGMEALCLLADIERRRGRQHAAVAALQRALSHGADAAQLGQVHLSLAKLYEHRLRDPAQALRHARRTTDAEPAWDQGRRLGRLARRLLLSDT